MASGVATLAPFLFWRVLAVQDGRWLAGRPLAPVMDPAARPRGRRRPAGRQESRIMPENNSYFTERFPLTNYAKHGIFTSVETKTKNQKELQMGNRERQDDFYAERLIELVKNEMAVFGMDLAAAFKKYMGLTAAPRRVQILTMKKLGLI
jgi:hypothetical protein